MCILTDGSEKPLPAGSRKVSDNAISIVWQLPNDRGGVFWKRSIPYLINNEVSFLAHLGRLYPRYVPTCSRVDKYTIELSPILPMRPTDPVKIWHQALYLQNAFKGMVRHGDLTRPHVLVTFHDQLVILDWAEARWWQDRAADKRPEDDWHHLWHSCQALLLEANFSKDEIKGAFDQAQRLLTSGVNP